MKENSVMNGAVAEIPVKNVVARLVARARAAQRIAARYDQAQVDELVLAAGWAIMDPARNRTLAELAVRDTGLGRVEDKILKNHRKTLGLLRDLRGAKSVGVVAEYPDKGLVEIARPVGVVAAIVPSTNPGATPANNIINALKGANAVILAPSPKGYSTSATLLQYIHAELARLNAPADLVQMLPHPVSKVMSEELMRQADLVVVTGSQANVRAGYASGTPALGVGAGNVVVIVDDSADLAAAAERIALSKTFDHATSCSSENSAVLLEAIYQPMLRELERQGGAMLSAEEKSKLQAVMFPQGKLGSATTAQPVAKICALAGLTRPELTRAKFLMVEETGTGRSHPFSGEKLCPVLAVYRAHDFDHAFAITQAIYDYQGNGHSVGIHTASDAHVLRLGLEMTVCRVIVNQAHCIANGGSFDNGLPFSLSMGCGTWGGNSFSENLNYRHFLNTTRIVRTIAPNEPDAAEIFADYRARHGI
ncbi:MAG: aldehyde dehydrogenase family protein [Betaproteobacteria bacterium]|nr:MAG: aldehyde dehydrogenase family protein [Betaproteobacteria bacterium]